MARPRDIVILAAIGAACAPAWAQTDRRLERVEPLTTDVSPLGAPGRVPGADLRVTNDFSVLYRIQGAQGSSLSGMYARVRGGVTAVFPRSQYTTGRNGLVAEIPAGTVFYVGGLPRGERQSSLRRIERPANYLDLSAPARPFEIVPPKRATTDGPAPDLLASLTPVEKGPFTDEALRAARLAQILDRARRAEK